MKIEYDIGKIKIEKEIEIDQLNKNGFLLTNNRGSFFSMPLIGNNSTFYNGLFMKKDTDKDPIKIIESIKINETEIKQPFSNKLWCAERKINTKDSKGKTKNVIERYIMPKDVDVLIYETENTKDIKSNLNLDMRKIYDFCEWGREYEFKEDEKYFLIVFKDKTTLAIYAKNAKINTKKEWHPTNYQLDSFRENKNSNWHVFNALDFELDNNSRIYFAFGDDENDAITELDLALSMGNELIIRERKYYEVHVLDKYLKKPPKNLNPERLTALIHSEKALHDLGVIKNIFGRERFVGIYAGLWWFFQFWSRDEAISCGALIELKHYNNAKDILMRNIEEILADGRIPNRHPHSDLGSADGVGWVFKRLMQLVKATENSKQKIFSDDELLIIKQKLWLSIIRIEKNYHENELIKNKGLETWMDTGEKDIRDGFRIEIQALYLSMLEFMVLLCEKTGHDNRKEIYEQKKEKSLKRIRDIFVDKEKNIIADGLNGKKDFTIRPNVFIAYYVYPDLFSKETWTKCFDNMLNSIWNEWGGVSTIDKNSSLYCEEYSGINNLSYHRGDSWFFVNNIVAMALFDLDKERYKDYIEKIVSASVNDILCNGLSGFCSEISSSKQQDSNGCPAQAWSSATFVEMMLKING